ncbi:MAG: ATP-binding cassette domain-containing protein, partial [Bacteroidota bacterium]
QGDKSLPMERVYRHISWSGPYLQPYQDFTLDEHLKLHFRFRKCLVDDPSELINILELEPHRDKKLRFYSSGMLQRVKVGTALFTSSDVLLLDEPTSNMDPGNASRMLNLIEQYRENRCYVLASNMPREYEGFEQKLQLG